jgi:hypothetical protein
MYCQNKMWKNACLIDDYLRVIGKKFGKGSERRKSLRRKSKKERSDHP